MCQSFLFVGFIVLVRCSDVLLCLHHNSDFKKVFIVFFVHETKRIFLKRITMEADKPKVLGIQNLVMERTAEAGTTCVGPFRAKISSCSWSFRKKNGQIIGWRPSRGCRPSGKSWIRHCLMISTFSCWTKRKH